MRHEHPHTHGGGPFAGGRGRRGGRSGRGRVRRGQIRTALLALLEEGPMHGYEMIRRIEERSGGRWKPSPGAVYPTLQQLTDEELVSVVEDAGKRIFSLTDAGSEAAAALDDGDREPWSGDGDDAGFELKAVMRQLGLALRSVAAAGDRDQIERAVAIVTDARRKLYAILAEEPSDSPDSPDDAPLL